jgi:hypothetical protein
MVKDGLRERVRDGYGYAQKVRVRNVGGQKKAIYRDELCGHNTAVDLLQGRRSID